MHRLQLADRALKSDNLKCVETLINKPKQARYTWLAAFKNHQTALTRQSIVAEGSQTNNEVRQHTWAFSRRKRAGMWGRSSVQVSTKQNADQQSGGGRSEIADGNNHMKGTCSTAPSVRTPKPHCCWGLRVSTLSIVSHELIRLIVFK